MKSTTILTGLVLTSVLAIVGVSDYLLRERPLIIAMRQQSPTVPSSETMTSSEGTQPATGTSSSKRIVKKGTQKKEFETVEQILGRTGFTLQPTKEATFLRISTTDTGKINEGVLLFENDRAALFAWIDDANVKALFLDLKEGLQQSFSPQIQDLRDEYIVPDEGAPMDLLSFFDPAISAEPIIFVRSRTRIYEFHIAPGKNTQIESLIQELGK